MSTKAELEQAVHDKEIELKKMAEKLAAMSNEMHDVLSSNSLSSSRRTLH